MRKRTDQRSPAAPQLVGLHTTDWPYAAIEDNLIVTQLGATGVNLSGQTAQNLTLEQVSLTDARLEQALPKARLVDVRFGRCTLTGVDFEKAHLTRVEFRACQLIGVKLPDAHLADVVMTECMLELSVFWSARCRAVRFERCQLRQAGFEGADLSGAVFRDCDLSGADFRGARLKGADLRGSTIAGVQLNPADVAGVIIGPRQAAALAGLLGAVVREDETDR
jgi:uncharacterized protein YjbI with pentapeptide repeats